MFFVFHSIPFHFYFFFKSKKHSFHTIYMYCMTKSDRKICNIYIFFCLEIHYTAMIYSQRQFVQFDKKKKNTQIRTALPSTRWNLKSWQIDWKCWKKIFISTIIHFVRSPWSCWAHTKHHLSIVLDSFDILTLGTAATLLNETHFCCMCHYITLHYI